MNTNAKGPVNMWNKRIADYALIHLGEMAATVGNITEDMTELLAHPDYIHGDTQISREQIEANIEERLLNGRNRAREALDYIAQGVSDLRAFEAAQLKD
ncbi:MAG: hypothetical protein ABSH16_04990 [Sedimentisphaerales bacterium]